MIILRKIIQNLLHIRMIISSEDYSKSPTHPNDNSSEDYSKSPTHPNDNSSKYYSKFLA